jgi:dolichyl-phosphate-mannose--protein O-mannosyl transferase
VSASESLPPPPPGGAHAADSRPGRSARSIVPAELVTWFFTPGALVALFVVGLGIRLVLMRGGGFPFDMSSFGAWAGTLADKGPWNFYPFDNADAFFVDYPPGYLYVLWIVGLVSKVVGGGGPSVALIKLPAVLADLVLAWLVASLAERLTPPAVARRVPVRALAAGAILLNPAVFFVSAVWGQADAVLAVLMVGAFLLLGTGEPAFRREAGGVALLALAFGTKPQAVFAVPIVVLLLVWRHLRPDVLKESRGALWTGVRRIATLAGTGVVAGFLMFAPFGMYPARAFDFYVRASRTYKVTSVFAFNLWGGIGFWKADSGNGADVIRILGIPAVIWGIVGFIALGGLVLARSWRALREGVDEGRVLVFGGVALTLVSFAVVTRVHERYLFLPLALLAVLVANRWMRRAFVVLSGLYLLNVYFPYVYYLDYVDRPAPKFGGFFDALYGTDIGGGRMRLLCLFVGASCLAIAALGWRAVRAPDTEEAEAPPADDPAVAVPSDGVDAVVEPDVGAVPRPWTLALHPVGRRGAALALGVFLVAFLMRLIGLGHPPGMYFDEVYHARAGAEYLGHKEVFEYTHPPLAKEIIGFSIQHMSGFGTRSGGRLPDGVVASSVATGTDGLVWARTTGGRTELQDVSIDATCRATEPKTVASLDLTADAVAAGTTALYVAGTSSDGATQLVRMQGSTESWRATIPDKAVRLTTVSDRAFLVTTSGDLVDVSPEGEARTLAVGAGALALASNDKEVWVAFPDDHIIAAYDTTGSRTSTIDTGGAATEIAAHRPSERVYVTVGDEMIAYDTERDTEHARVPIGSTLTATVPETHVVWAVDGNQVRAIEPHSASVIGQTAFAAAPQRLVADPVRHGIVGIAGRNLECAGGRPQFAWRFGSAVMGAVMVAFLFLLALRLFGNRTLALLAALFLAIDGLAFTISRIAMNDSYSMGFVLMSWFCAVSALYAWGRGGPNGPDAALLPGETPGPPAVRSRRAAIGWLFAAGFSGGLGLASKWPALYALAGIGLLMLWDGFDRKERSIWRVAGGFVPSVLLIAVAMGALPLAVYFVTYLPYMSLGHSFPEVLTLQRGMYNYHATLKATHPYGSPWYGWPFGHRAVYLYVHSTPAGRSEIWTFPNLVVFWGGLVGLVIAARAFLRERSATLALVFGPALVQYLPWVLVSRVTFMYHYLPVVPFLALGLAWLLVRGLEGRSYHRTALLVTPLVAVAFFVFSYPILVGWEMPVSYLDLTRVFSWVIP